MWIRQRIEDVGRGIVVGLFDGTIGAAQFTAAHAVVVERLDVRSVRAFAAVPNLWHDEGPLRGSGSGRM